MLEARIAAKRLASGEVLLRDVPVAASPGAVVALLGASGTGKTSILRILLGLDRAFEGTVRCEASRVGALFQEPRLLPWRTVGDNIRLVVPGRDHAPDIAALLGSVGLAAGVEELYPRQLSLGMARRASLARALAAAPELLVLDEPFASLDPGSAGVVAARIALAAQGGVAVVIALHDVARAAALATSIVVLAGRPATVACQVDIAAHALVPERARVQEDLVQRFPFLSDGPEREGQGALPHDPAIG